MLANKCNQVLFNIIIISQHQMTSNKQCNVMEMYNKGYIHIFVHTPGDNYGRMLTTNMKSCT